MKLFHVQDLDSPKYVLASDWQEALHKWRCWIFAEEDDDAEKDFDAANPLGIMLVAEEDELIE